jgi:hypothetical protein
VVVVMVTVIVTLWLCRMIFLYERLRMNTINSPSSA